MWYDDAPLSAPLAVAQESAESNLKCFSFSRCASRSLFSEQVNMKFETASAAKAQRRRQRQQQAGRQAARASQPASREAKRREAAPAKAQLRLQGGRAGARRPEGRQLNQAVDLKRQNI